MNNSTNKSVTPFKTLRLLNGYSQDEMAKRLGCTVQTIRKLDSGDVGHNAYYIRKKALELFKVEDSLLFPL